MSPSTESVTEPGEEADNPPEPAEHEPLSDPPPEDTTDPPPKDTTDPRSGRSKPIWLLGGITELSLILMVTDFYDSLVEFCINNL